MNAGIASVEWNKTDDGWERSLQVNVLSLALLGLELLPLLLLARSSSDLTLSAKSKSKTKPHLTILASDIHRTAKFPERHNAQDILSSLNTHSTWQTSQKLGGPTERYAVTKLFDIYTTQALAEIVPRDTTKNNERNGDPAVIVNCVAPGFCKSNLLSREEGIPWVVKVVQWVTGRTVEEGGKTVVDALVRGVESHGAWMEDLVVRDPGEIVTGPDMARVREQVWGEIVDVLRGVEPGLRTEY
ncbi:hypothetical protein BJY01DRAFT_226354 [Aspergillus pseudoustus]|uniref:NAD(P)-binding protein n=1 Tax=Aspergillus pseudoustus TaxID=1810923 RepID=A0ABR4IVT2_9EURO